MIDSMNPSYRNDPFPKHPRFPDTDYPFCPDGFHLRNTTDEEIPEEALDTNRKISDRLHRAFDQLDITKGCLAKCLSISVKTLSDWLDDPHKIKRGAAIYLCMLLGVSGEWVRFGTIAALVKHGLDPSKPTSSTSSILSDVDLARLYGELTLEDMEVVTRTVLALHQAERADIARQELDAEWLLAHIDEPPDEFGASVVEYQNESAKLDKLAGYVGHHELDELLVEAYLSDQDERQQFDKLLKYYDRCITPFMSLKDRMELEAQASERLRDLGRYSDGLPIPADDDMC